MATHSCILAWRIPWTEETGGLPSTWLQRIRHDWVTTLSFSTNIHLGRCSAFVCAHLQFVIYSTRSKNSHLLKWGLAWSLRNPQKQPWVWCDQRTFTVTLREALWGLVSTWGNRSLVPLCGRSQRVERDCLCLNCYQKKKTTVIKTLIMPSCDYPEKTVLKSRAAIFFHHKLKTFKVIAIINCRILIDQKKFF